MSLLDALLLEPPKFEVWIALRTDGVLGSGTQSDPYDGSAIKTAPVEITSLSVVSGTGILAEATLANHGLEKGDVIVVWRADKPADGDWWDGTFMVESVPATNKFRYVMQREPLSGSPGARRFQKYITWRFDDRMTELPEKITVHVGPGIFETRGHGEQPNPPDPKFKGWRPKTGQRILGAGMGLTTLKLAGASAPAGNHKTAVIDATAFLEGFEVADLTIDCNADDQPSILAAQGGSTQAAFAAIQFLAGGRHIYVHRVRAINFGSRFRDFYTENFVFYQQINFTDQTTDVVWEDCVAESPSPNNSWNSFMFVAGGTGEETQGGAVRVQGRAGVIRNCYVDARNNYGPLVPIANISYASGKVTVTTLLPHGRRKPGNVIVSGVALNSSFDNKYNGIFAIDEVIDDFELKYTPAADPGGSGSGGTVGGLVSSTEVSIESIEAGSTGDARQLKLVTKDPHLRTTNNTIHLINIHKANTVPPNSVHSIALSLKTFPIVKYDPAKPKELEFRIYQDLDIPLAQLDYGQALAKAGHTGSGSDEGITENNHFSHISVGGPYQDFWARSTLVARNNYYHNVNLGPALQLGNVSFWSGSIIMESLEYDDSELVCPTLALHSFAEFENSVIIGKLYAIEPTPPPDPTYVTPWVGRHGFIKKPAMGDPDYVNIVKAGGVDASLYLGAFAVVDAPDSRTFTYQANGVVTTKASGPEYRPYFPNGNRGHRPLKSMTATAQVTSQGDLVWKIHATVRHLYQTTFKVNHGMQAGEVVNITNAGAHPDHSSLLNGFFKITAVGSDDPNHPDDLSWFEFLVSRAPNDPDPTAGDFSPGYYGRMWGLDWFLSEGNIIELNIRTLGVLGYNLPIGIFIYGGGAVPQYRMRQLVIRDNLIRNIDNRSDPKAGDYAYNGFAFGIELKHNLLAENALLQKNVIRLERNEALYPWGSMPYIGSNLKTFDNNSPDGKVILARDSDSGKPAPESVQTIQAAVEDAIITSFFK